jgi:hypothetical protein
LRFLGSRALEEDGMAEIDHRLISRDSLFLMADLRSSGSVATERVKVRNLSAGGMMAEGAENPVRGTLVELNLRNIGWVQGEIAWVHGNRCGIAFNEDIDPKLARAPVVGIESPTLVRAAQSMRRAPLRKL